MTHASGVRSDKWTADVRDGSPEVAVAGQVQRLNPRLPQDRRAADGIREVDMAQTRGILLASIVLGLSVGMNPAAAQKKYDPGATDSEIKIGNIMPYSGPLSAYALIGRTQDAFFKKLNAEAGINGRKINFVSYDDSFSPAKTVEQARKLVESDEVLLIFQSLGTPTNNAIQKYLNEKKVPQLFVATGATKFGDPKNFPWTMGWQPTYQTEGRIYAKYILEKLPQGKIGILYQNDDSGRDYLKGLKDGLGAQATQRMIVGEIPYEPTDPTVDRQIVTLKTLGADIFFNEASPKFAAQAIRKSAEIGWKPSSSLPASRTRSAPCSSPPGSITLREFCLPTTSRTLLIQHGRTIPRSRNGPPSWISISPKEIRRAPSVSTVI